MRGVNINNKQTMRHEVYLQLILRKFRRWRKKTQSTIERERVRRRILKLFGMYLVLKRKQEAQERLCWVRPIFSEQRRSEQGASNNLVREFRENEPTTEKYEDFFRMPPQMFEELLSLLEPRLTKQNVVRQSISARTRLEITLRYLATGDSMKSMSYLFRVGHNTISKIVSETCQVIWDVLRDVVFPEPTEEMWIRKAYEFEVLWNFTHCIGSIDGKHVVIQVNHNIISCVI